MIPATFPEYTPERQTELINEEIQKNFMSIHDREYHQQLAKELRKRVEETYKLKKRISTGYSVKTEAPSQTGDHWEINFS
jgi:CRISPR/Cas system endoribonuclease Cas6 (RAMP superfamily)